MARVIKMIPASVLFFALIGVGVIVVLFGAVGVAQQKNETDSVTNIIAEAKKIENERNEQVKKISDLTNDKILLEERVKRFEAAAKAVMAVLEKKPEVERQEIYNSLGVSEPIVGGASSEFLEKWALYAAQSWKQSPEQQLNGKIVATIETAMKSLKLDPKSDPEYEKYLNKSISVKRLDDDLKNHLLSIANELYSAKAIKHEPAKLDATTLVFCAGLKYTKDYRASRKRKSDLTNELESEQYVNTHIASVVANELSDRFGDTFKSVGDLNGKMNRILQLMNGENEDPPVATLVAVDMGSAMANLTNDVSPLTSALRNAFLVAHLQSPKRQFGLFTFEGGDVNIQLPISSYDYLDWNLNEDTLAQAFALDKSRDQVDSMQAISAGYQKLMVAGDGKAKRRMVFVTATPNLQTRDEYAKRNNEFGELIQKFKNDRTELWVIQFGRSRGDAPVEAFAKAAAKTGGVFQYLTFDGSVGARQSVVHQLRHAFYQALETPTVFLPKKRVEEQ